LIIEALRDERILLTRNSRISDFAGPRIIKIASDSVEAQLAQVVRALKLEVKEETMFTRCTLCNTRLVRKTKEMVKEKVPEYVYQMHNTFLQCPECERVYWQGTHWGNVKDFLHSAGLY
jgi:uncharacterized protein with PIN domain